MVVQSLFSSLGREYFVVNLALRSRWADSTFTTLVSTVLPNMPPLKMQVEVQGREIPPLHQVTQWWDILGDHVHKWE